MIKFVGMTYKIYQSKDIALIQFLLGHYRSTFPNHRFIWTRNIKREYFIYAQSRKKREIKPRFYKRLRNIAIFYQEAGRLS